MVFLHLQGPGCLRTDSPTQVSIIPQYNKQLQRTGKHLPYACQSFPNPHTNHSFVWNSQTLSQYLPTLNQCRARSQTGGGHPIAQSLLALLKLDNAGLFPLFPGGHSKESDLHAPTGPPPPGWTWSPLLQPTYVPTW